MNKNKQNNANRPLVAPVISVREDADGYILRADLPGVMQDAVELTVEDRTLILEAENTVATPEGYTMVRQEIPPLCYHAVFEIPERVEAGGIQSTLENGVLTVTLPKREEVKPRRISVTAG